MRFEREHRLTWEDHLKLGHELKDAADMLRRVKELIEKRMGSSHKTSRRSAKLEESISQLAADLTGVLKKDFSDMYPQELYSVYHEGKDPSDSQDH